MSERQQKRILQKLDPPMDAQDVHELDHMMDRLDAQDRREYERLMEEAARTAAEIPNHSAEEISAAYEEEVARIRKAFEENPHLVFELDRLPKANGVRQNWSSKDQEMLTPKALVDDIIRFWGEIDLDPCAEDPGMEDYNVPATWHYTKEDDGLSRPWTENDESAFVNPPYNEMAAWTAKALEELRLSDGAHILLLCPARPGRGWWHDLRKHPVLLFESRLHFGGAKDSAPFPSAMFYLHHEGLAETKRFAEAFQNYGDVWRRVRF